MNLDFKKTNGLIPAIIQDSITLQVLMTGYMNEEAYTKTCKESRVTFYSRSKNRLWTKGETSGNFLDVVSIVTDCDNDALLIKVLPSGPVCHTGAQSCFSEEASAKGFLYQLEDIIDKRITQQSESSYTVSLFKKGINKMAQKVGEEAVELVIEAKDNDINLFKNEAADLFYHLLVLFRAKNVTLQDLEEVLKGRM
jgi:phosphoribosyl-ATP pyrophosphohydrolase/phosphoribosyl-AMP cyclohydrolase